jgi:hypothetical protein
VVEVDVVDGVTMVGIVAASAGIDAQVRSNWMSDATRTPTAFVNGFAHTRRG